MGGLVKSRPMSLRSAQRMFGDWRLSLGASGRSLQSLLETNGRAMKEGSFHYFGMWLIGPQQTAPVLNCIVLVLTG
jgi:hypothetical protein